MVSEDNLPNNTPNICHPDKHEWVAFSTALAEGWIMVQCVECGAHGTVDDPTRKEWSEAFHAPSNPYRWEDNSRVTIRHLTGPCYVERKASNRGNLHMAEAFDILCQVIQSGEPVPNEIVVPLEDDNELTWKTVGLLEAVKKQIAASA